MSEITTFPAPNRRAFLTRALAGAAGATIAASTAHAALPGAVDPLIALGAEWLRIDTRLNGPSQPDDIYEEEIAELNRIEEQIEALVPISAAGAAVQVDLLRDRGRAFEWCEFDDQIADNLIAGLRAMAAGGVA
jgi:hypothetical protein